MLETPRRTRYIATRRERAPMGEGKSMNWREHIETKPDIMGGKPVIRDTRITVEIVLDWLAAGWSEAELFENYPRLSPDSLKAVFAFAREIVADQLYTLVPRAA